MKQISEEMQKYGVECKIVSSLEKVLPNVEPVSCAPFSTLLKNQELNFQLAFRCKQKKGLRSAKIVAKGALAQYTQIYRQELAPVTYTPHDADDYYISREITMIPDALLPFGEMGFTSPYNQWRAVWVSLKLPLDIECGVYTIEFELNDCNDSQICETQFTVEVLDAVAPNTNLKLTNWIHYDCIAKTHGVELFSNAFYEVFDSYLQVYRETGFNMLFTPLFTPPLDTKIGGERETAQLVKVYKKGEEYSFDFGQLREFFRFARSRGIEYFELSHLFTQWGGKYCPKIMAVEDGIEKRIFGWETNADDPSYIAFLNSLLPKLVEVLKEEDVQEKCCFHLTDEPTKEHLLHYENCRNIVKKNIGNIPTIDAVENPSFCKNGLVDIPVVVTYKYDEFNEVDKTKLFAYSCCYPAHGYFSNRFINMPSQRTRVLGLQLYRNESAGYLHWGFNFYNSWLSKESVNPYAVTDAGGVFPCGDSFIVYPAGKGAYGSIRSKVLKEGFQDYDALRLLESFIGKEEVMRLLSEWGVEGFAIYPRSSEAHLAFREKINGMIKEYCI